MLWTCRKQMRFLLTVTIKVSSAYSQITHRSGCFRCWRRRRRENLRAQAKASMAASPSHFTILFPAKILHTKTHYDFQFLATVPWSSRRHWDPVVTCPLILFPSLTWMRWQCVQNRILIQHIPIADNSEKSPLISKWQWCLTSFSKCPRVLVSIYFNK